MDLIKGVFGHPSSFYAIKIKKKIKMLIRNIFHAPIFIVEQISGAIFQGGGLRSTTFVSIYQNVRIGL